MARVNCYLPDELMDRALEELPAEVSFSQVLRIGLIEVLDGERAGPRVRSSRRRAPAKAT